MLGALALAASAAAADPTARRIPVADFAALPVFTEPLLSPDGHRIAARRVADGKTTLAILDADHPETPVRVIALGETVVYALQWAGNDRLLLTVLAKRHIYHVNVDIPFLRLIAIDVSSGASRIVDNKS